MSDTMKIFAAGLVGSLMTAFLVTAVTAIADGNPATDQVPRLIHYTGTLERDGGAFTGDLPMTFTVYDGADDVWSETQHVSVYAGRFSVMLGATAGGASLSQVVGGADDLYLEIGLDTNGDEEGGEVTLANRQRFLPAPFALWTTAATNFRVHGVVEGGLEVRGSNLDPVDGQPGEFTNVLRLRNGSQSLFMDGNEIVSNGTLYLNGDSGQLVDIGSGLAEGVPYALDVGGRDVEPLADGSDYEATVKIHGGGGNLWMDGNEINSSDTLYLNNETTHAVQVGGAFAFANQACREDACGASNHGLPGGLGFGSWHSWVDCPAGKYVCGMRQRVEPSQGSDADDTAVNDIDIRCCPF